MDTYVDLFLRALYSGIRLARKLERLVGSSAEKVSKQVNIDPLNIPK